MRLSLRLATAVAVLALEACGSGSISQINTERLLRAAEQADNAGDYQACITDYTQILVPRPEVVSAYVGRASCYMKQGDLVPALHDYSEAIRLSPEDPDLYVLRGDVEQELGNKTSAASDYKKLGQFTSAGPLQLVRSAQGLGGMSFYSDALNLLDVGIQRYGDFWALHEYRAEVETALSNDAEAIKEFNIAARAAVGADLATALRHRGDFYLQRLEYKQAVADYSRAIDIDATEYRLFEGRGQARRALGDSFGAIADLTMAVQIYSSLGSTDPDVLVYLLLQRGRLYLQMGGREQAVADFKKALAVARPSNKEQLAEIQKLIASAGG